MHKIQEVALNRLRSRLERTSIVKPSQWAERYRIMGGNSFAGPWTFKHHPWLREMHNSTAYENVGQKAAQMGFTEVALNMCFYKMDVEGTSCLYVLPNKTPDASDFTSSRFDPAISLSPYLRDFFSDVENVGHKRAGSTSLFVRGSKSKSGLKSQPVGFIVMDEVAEFDQDNIPLIPERMSGQLSKQMWSISTPTVKEENINKTFQESSQEEFFFKCPKCSRAIELTWEDSFVKCGDDINDPRKHESYYCCPKCKGKLDHELKHEYLDTVGWVPKYKDREIRGFHINQLYSPSVTPLEMINYHFLSLKDAAKAQELFNSKLGLCYEEKGARVTTEEIENCKGNYLRGDGKGSLITIGVDVGVKELHYVVTAWVIPKIRKSTDVNVDAHAKVINYGKVETFEQLDLIIRRYRPRATVIDANPERRKALNLASRFPGLVNLCHYAEGQSGRDIKFNVVERSVNVDRTSWLDLTLGRFRSNMVTVPIDIDREFISHLKALVRIYKLNKNNSMIAKYNNPSEDHYAHALNYSEIAFACRKPAQQIQDI